MLTEYEKGKRDIAEWLAVSREDLIPWKIRVCLDNYPRDPRRQPYYDAMLEELNRVPGQRAIHEQEG